MTPFGILLEQFRRSRRLQQNDLAKATGVQPCYISSMERGKKGPPSTDVTDLIKHHLDLNEAESQQLDIAIQQSQRVIKLPENTSADEFVFVSKLKNRFGSLSQPEIEIMTRVLDLAEVKQRGEAL